ncbi:MAG TPA: TfoX/Sxy family protein [Cellulomonadaceae bacterium]|nr:TfoX/Sxy family protein [Cellulomonadaceae bacterium]
MAYDEELADRLRECVQGEVGVSEKRMFGGVAFLVNGIMAVSASGQGGLLVRVDPSRTSSLAGEPHAQRAVMRGREMDGWLRIGPDGVRIARDLERWVGIGLDYARTLPPR